MNDSQTSVEMKDVGDWKEKPVYDENDFSYLDDLVQKGMYDEVRETLVILSLLDEGEIDEVIEILSRDVGDNDGDDVVGDVVGDEWVVV